MESIGSIIDNLLNFLLLDWGSCCDWDGIVKGSWSSGIVTIVAGIDENDVLREFGKLPFGRFRVRQLFSSWFEGSTDADLSLGVSKETDDGIWWILNAELFWSNFNVVK